MKKIITQLIVLIAMVCCCQFSNAQCPNGGSSNIDVDLDGYCDDVDCNDNNNAIHPGATELCNGVDDDCDGIADQNSIVRFQYFFDTEPGVGLVGNGAFINVSPTSDSSNISTSITTAGLSEGFHTLYMRAQSVNGSWGLWRSYPFTITPPPTVTNHTVTHGEYYFDTETGVASAIQLPIGVSPADSVNFISSIPTTGLSVGFHTLYLRVKDSQNHWGLWRSYPFAVTPPPPPVSQIVDGEAFFDTDPGVGNGIPLWLPTTPLDSVNIARNVFAPNTLGNGTHYAYFRWRDSNGKWGLFDRDTFTVNGSACVLPAAITANGPIAICTGDQVVLTENSMGSFTWQWKESGNPVGTNSRHLTVNSSGTYTCEVTSGTCTATSNTIVVAVYPPSTWYQDFDNDSYGNNAITQIACVQPLNYVSNNTDCDDNNINIHTPIQYYVDADHDSYGSTTTALVCALTAPSGYSTNDDDCDDTNININPGVTEICGNGLDDDCNGIIDGNQFTLSATVQNVLCKGLNTGSINLSESVAGVYTFLWSNGKTTEDISNLYAGTYTVTASDNCRISTKSITVTEPSAGLLTTSTSVKPKCFGSANGKATVTVSGGSGVYSYLWSNGQTTPTATGLAAGIYTLSISDGACYRLSTITVLNPPALAANITIVTTPTNLNPTGGSLMATASGGTPNYLYLWYTSPIKTTATITGLSAGTYSVKVTDKNSCTKTSVVVLNTAAKLIDTQTELSQTNINVMPNPSDGLFSVKIASNKTCAATIRLVDGIGRVLIAKKMPLIIGDNQTEIDARGFPKGIYMLLFEHNGDLKTVRVVIR